MNRIYLLLLPGFLAAITSCSKPGELPPLEINGFELGSAEPEQLARWYMTNLDFEKTTEPGLILINSATTLSFTKVAQPEEGMPLNKRHPGFFKMGFKANQLDSLFTKLLRKGSQFRGDIFYDQNLRTRSFVALDADGNRVQFFEDESVSGLRPYFFSVMALDFQATKDWCQSQFGFEEAFNLDLPERGLQIRLLKKDSVLLELISDQRLSDDGGYLQGIEGILFNRSDKRRGEGKLIFKAGL